MPHHARLLESPAGHSIPGPAQAHTSTISLSQSLQIHAAAKTRSLAIPVSPQTPSRLAMSLTGQSPYLTDHSHATFDETACCQARVSELTRSVGFPGGFRLATEIKNLLGLGLHSKGHFE